MSSPLAKPPAYASEPAEGQDEQAGGRDTDGPGRDDGGQGRPSRRFRPVALILELGAIAGALLSIFAVVQLVVPDDDGEKNAAPRPPQRVTLSLPPRSVHVMTLREYLSQFGEPGSSAELASIGFTVRYDVATRGYVRGTILHARIELWELTEEGDHYVRPPTWDSIEVQRDPDTCTCTSTFIELPRADTRYRLVIGLFAPGVTKSNPGAPLKSDDTEFRVRPSRT